MGLLDRIRRALEHKKKIAPVDKKSELTEPPKKKKTVPVEVSELKKKLLQLHKEATKQGKRVESLNVVLDIRFPSRSVFEFTTTNLQDPHPPMNNYCKRRTMIGKSYDYDEKSVWVQEFQPHVKVYLVVLRDGTRDIVKFTWSDGLSQPKRTIWWIENKEKVCKKLKSYCYSTTRGTLDLIDDFLSYKGLKIVPFLVDRSWGSP